MRITSIFGSDKAGPANNNASAGPFPIPDPSRPSTIGTSVKVEKYMKAPSTDANNVDSSELSPTAMFIHSLGIKPLCPGRPNNSPAIKTPAISNGMICFVKSQV